MTEQRCDCMDVEQGAQQDIVEDIEVVQHVKKEQSQSKSKFDDFKF